LRLCADENVAPKLSLLLREQLLSKGFQLDIIDDHAARSVDDQIWVRKFAASGGQAIIGGDAAMSKKPHEVVAIAETGLILIILDERWPQQKKHVQISYLFYWWPHIEVAIKNAKPGQCLKVPWGWNHPKDEIKLMAIDVQAAYKKVRKG
jgi:hypothetical protein